MIAPLYVSFNRQGKLQYAIEVPRRRLRPLTFRDQDRFLDVVCQPVDTDAVTNDLKIHGFSRIA